MIFSSNWIYITVFTVLIVSGLITIPFRIRLSLANSTETSKGDDDSPKTAINSIQIALVPSKFEKYFNVLNEDKHRFLPDEFQTLPHRDQSAPITSAIVYRPDMSKYFTNDDDPFAKRRVIEINLAGNKDESVFAKLQKKAS